MNKLVNTQKWNHEFNYPYRPRVIEMDDLTIFSIRKVGTRFLSNVLEKEVFDFNLSIEPTYSPNRLKDNDTSFFSEDVDLLYNKNIRDNYESLELFRKCCESLNLIFNKKSNRKSLFLYREPKERFRSGFIQEAIDLIHDNMNSSPFINSILNKRYDNICITEFLNIFDTSHRNLNLLHKKINNINKHYTHLTADLFEDIFSNIILYCLNSWLSNKKLFHSHTSNYLIYLVYLKNILKKENSIFINITSTNLTNTLENLLNKKIIMKHNIETSNEIFYNAFKNAIVRAPSHIIDDINNYLEPEVISYRILETK